LVALMSKVPAVWAGEVAMISVGETRMTDAAGTAPKLTVVSGSKLVPVMVTTVPPAVLPLLVSMLLMVGADTEE
jgi:hypothetical protein